MEILVTTFTLLALVAAIILVVTRGRVQRVFTAFGDTVAALRENLGPLALITASVFLVLGFLYFFYMSPATAIGPEQPIPFSHRLHAGHKAIQCQFCHPYVGESIHPGLPPVDKCLYCHRYIIANHPQIKKEHKYFDTNTPTPWRKVYLVAEHVLFNHERHIRKGIECQSCHGAVETMDRLKGKRFYMSFCLECHREKKANIGCWLACHS
jgi:hypothetical protein